jgi:hypothetical protein
MPQPGTGPPGTGKIAVIKQFDKIIDTLRRLANKIIKNK